MDIIPCKEVPVWQERGGLGAEIGEDQALALYHGVRGDVDALLERVISLGLVIGHFDALASLIVAPAVVRAPQAVFGGDAEEEVDPAMCALVADEAEHAGFVAIE